MHFCRGIRQACEALTVAAAKLKRSAQPAANRRAKRETEQALQHLAEAVDQLH